MEKSCENCNFKYRCDAGNAYTCQKRNYVNWKLDYLTLESQLAKANALIVEQIEQIAKERDELEQYKKALRLIINEFDKFHMSNCGSLDCEECDIDDCYVRELGLAITQTKMNMCMILD